MPISSLMSVTQSTAPTPSINTSAENQIWQAALDTANAMPCPKMPPPPAQTANQAADAPPNPSRVTTLQAVSTRGGEADQSSSVQSGKTTVASGGRDLSPVSTTGKDKKDTAKTPVQGNLTALPMSMTMVANVPDVAANSGADGKSGTSLSGTAQVDTNLSQTGGSTPADAKPITEVATHPKPATPDAQAQPAPLVQTTASPATPPPATQATVANTTVSKHPAMANKLVISANAVTTNIQITSPKTAAGHLDTAALNQDSTPLQTADLKKTTNPAQTIQAVETNGASSAIGGATAADKTAQTGFANPGSVNLAPAALSATITALHQSGQSSVMLRLDPPDLGHLSVQIKMDMQGGLNVLFVPTSADAAQTLQSSLHQLGGIMAQSGLTLSQAEVGGQFSQSGGQNGQQSGYTPPRQTAASAAASSPPPASPTSGLSTYA